MNYQVYDDLVQPVLPMSFANAVVLNWFLSRHIGHTVSVEWNDSSYVEVSRRKGFTEKEADKVKSVYCCGEVLHL